MPVVGTVYVRASRAQLTKLFAKLPSWVSGRSSGPPLVRQLQIRVGLAALSLIKEAFVLKARGGTDDTGLRWAPLSPYTIAYSRRHPGVPSKRQRARFAPSWILSRQQRRLWWDYYRRFLARYKGDKAHAAAVSWFVCKEMGFPTMMQTYGNTPVEILRDTGLLLNSLSPATPPDAATTSPPQRPAQVFRLLRGEVVVGTKRKWAGTHHRGIPGRLPQRRLWPEPSRWTPRWWSLMLTQARLGVLDLVLWLLRRSSP